jgi:hypothetical protein
MLRMLLITLALVAAATALAVSGMRGMSDGGLRHAAGKPSPAGKLGGGVRVEKIRRLGMSDGGL